MNQFALKKLALTLVTLQLVTLPVLAAPADQGVRIAQVPTGDPSAPSGAVASGTPTDQAAALAGAEQALTTLSTARTLPSLAQSLTDKSAADVSVACVMIIGLTLGLSDAFSSPKSPKFSAKDPTLEDDFNAYLDQYGLGKNAPSSSNDDLPAGIKDHGRDLLSGMSPFMDRFNNLIPPGGIHQTTQDNTANSHSSGSVSMDRFSVSDIIKAIPTNLASYNATVLSPSRVKLVPKLTPKPGMPGTLLAVLEDGTWRIDLGDLIPHNGGGKPTSSTWQTNTGSKADPEAKVLFDAINNLQLPRVKQILHKHPKFLNARNTMGETPLIKAAFDNSKPIAAYLLTLHPDLTAKDDFGDTAYKKAVFFHHDDIAKLLHKHGAK